MMGSEKRSRERFRLDDIAHFVVSDRYYQVNYVIIDQFTRVRMRQQSERSFFRSLGIESAHEGAHELDGFLK